MRRKKLHWRLDVATNEDGCRIRRGNAAELFSGIRHVAVNILTNHKEFKAGLRRKMRKAAMDRNYLASVLAGWGFRNLALTPVRKASGDDERHHQSQQPTGDVVADFLWDPVPR